MDAIDSKDYKIVKGRRTAVLVICLILTIALGIFAVAVWPTLYRYDHLKLDGDELPVRINRITGTAQILYSSGWEPAESEADAYAEVLEDVPKDELAQLEGTAEISETGSQLKCMVHNPFHWRLREVVVNLRVFVASDDPIEQSLARVLGRGSRWLRKSDDGPMDRLIINRDFRLEGLADPLTTGLFQEYVWLDYSDRYTFDWSIRSAKRQQSIASSN